MGKLRTVARSKQGPVTWTWRPKTALGEKQLTLSRGLNKAHQAVTFGSEFNKQG